MISRRQFLKHTGLLAAGAALAPQLRAAPSNRITIGSIGVGGEGMKNLNVFLGQPDAQVVAVCDVDRKRLYAARDRVNQEYKNAGCTTCEDFREIIARKDIDAVMISTPDHWHVPISLMALRAGKDVICEKPTLTLADGRLLADTVKRYGAVFQLSTEDRSLAVYHRMAELVRNGRIGKLQRIHVGLPRGPASSPEIKPEPPPKELNYDLWLGPAPWSPYCKGRLPYDWRWISDYSGGMLTDWGAHLLDTAQWANDTEHTGPVEVEGSGRRHEKGLYDTFYDFRLQYKYASGVEMEVTSGNVALRFEGTDGWIANDGWIGPLQASSPEILRNVIGPEETHLFTCPGGEHRNFLDCVKSRRDPYFPAEIGHRCCSVAHLGNIAMELGRKLRWDPVKEEFAHDEEANRLRWRAMREPWNLL